MSDKSFGDNANRNIVKNPLLSTAVTGLSFEDLTHNAVLVPVAPNQGVITESDLSGTHTQTLENTDNAPTNITSFDSNLNIQTHALPPQSSISTHSHLDSQTGLNYDRTPERPTSTVSKASAKSEDDFDVNEYFARLQGTRYVSAPIHSHPDPNANLSTTEDNLEEINLNDDKTLEVQQSITADIAQNFSQLPNVLPHVASAVFSSFSNMWNMKSREQTPDDKAQSYHDIQFQGNQTSNQFHGHQSQSYQEVQLQGSQTGLNQYQGLESNISSVPMMSHEDVVKEVAPPPKEPPVCGTSNFRLLTKKKYAQIPGLSTKESQPIIFNPMTQNVPSYFIPTQEPHEKTEENIEIPQQQPLNVVLEQKQQELNEPAYILNPTENTTPVFVTTENQRNVFEEASPINLQNQVPLIPPPPMFSSQQRDNHTGKTVLPPSVARRIRSNNPVMKEQTMQSIAIGHIFVPNFDSLNPEGYTCQTSDSASQIQKHSSQMLTSDIQQAALPLPQEILNNISLSMALQTAPSQQIHTIPVKIVPDEKSSVFNLTVHPTAPNILTPGLQTSDISTTPSVPTFSSTNFSDPGPTVLPPPSYLFSPSASTGTGLPPDPRSIINPRSTLLDTAVTQEAINEPLKPPIEPPKSKPTSSFRMIKKRPQYYSGPIEGIGSLSNNIKPVIPTIDSGAFQGALFTPEQPQSDQSAPLFDISKQADAATPYTPYDSSSDQYPTYPIYDGSQPAQNYSNQFSTAFDFSRPTTDIYEEKGESQEIKGFGIIGSLKSKLSSLDINKIQNSVTNFFDPAYNETKKDNRAIQDNLNYDLTQYPSQSNLEIFVPSVEERQQFSYQDHQPTNNQTYQDYNPYFEQHDAKYVVPNTGYPNQPIANNIYTTEQTQTFGQTQLNVRNNNIQADNTQIVLKENIPFVETNLVTKSEPDERSQMLHHNKTREEIINRPDTISSLQDNLLKSDLLPKTQIIGESLNKLTGIEPCRTYEPYKDTTVNYPKPTSFLPTTDPKTLFEMSSNYGFYPATSVAGNTCNMPTQPIAYELKSEPHRKRSMEEDKKYNISMYKTQQVGILPNVPYGNVEKQDKPTEVFSKASGKFDVEVKSSKDNLLESLTKGDTPILAVSSVPLFGLSAIIADKAREDCGNKDAINFPLYERTKNKDVLDRNAGISFFENINTAIDKYQEVGNSKNVDILDSSYQPSSGFFEKDIIKTDILDAQISNTNFFTSNQKREEYDLEKKVDRKLSLSNSAGVAIQDDDFGLNKDIVLDREKELIKDDVGLQEDVENISELNICETCREVNKPEEKETKVDDLTNQLIENITSPILLSNAVEVPLTEDINSDRVDFDSSQYKEISHVTEETIETIQVQSAIELLEDSDINIIKYGWKNDEKYDTNLKRHQDYNVKNIGLFGESLFVDNVPTNASDELKAEYKHQDLLPRQMIIPSAPPAEDLKSDEAGILDVQSIELDAKQDFPIYEEFVIEPSETDDDKIEYKEKGEAEKCDLDSFTHRVEKFKKMEEVSDFEQPKEIQSFIESSNHPVSMASYFDTGNYAAEAHYRNTIHSPQAISIPPGFEEEFKKKLALAKAVKNAMKVIPETSTQTETTVSVSFTTAQRNIDSRNAMSVGFNIEEIVSNIVEDKTNDLSESIFNAGRSWNVLPETSTTYSAGEAIMSQVPSVYSSRETITQKNAYVFGSKEKIIPEASNVFGAGEPKMSEARKMSVTEEAKLPITSYLFGSGEAEMPKMSNIFGTVEALETSKILSFMEAKSPNASIAFNSFEPRKTKMAPNFDPSSTMAAPDSELVQNISTVKKPSETKLPDPINFFAETTVAPNENFNRLASYFSSPPKTDHAKSFFELSQSQNHYRHEKNNENYNDLIKDLTSVQNLAVPTDQVIRHVNYFTVEYDTVIPENKGDSKGLLVESDDKCLDYLSNCRYCTDLICDKSLKVKTAVNDSKETGNTMPNMENIPSAIRQSVTVNFDGIPMNEETSEGVAGITTENRSSSEYTPVKHHWFYRVDVEEKSIWRGFSVVDSRSLETTFLSPDLNEDTVVPTDGGRYDVNLIGRLRIPVYWTDKPTNVRRCSWFYKGTTDPRYVPYTESVAEKLELEYQHGVSTGEWHRRLLLPNGEVVVMHGPNVMVHFLHSDAFSSPPQSASRPRVVRRGHDDSEIEDAEPSSIDHLLLLCHGVGSACDMRFRSVEEVVEDFRATSLQLVQSHYRNSYDQGVVSRVEVLPISWHATLHSGETGVDRRLSQITLESIPRLRNFTNDTVLDVLFYTSPVFCQTITDTVCKELNRIYKLFTQRNPGFKGGVSLGGHSLGSVILYDLLCHQIPRDAGPVNNSSNKYYVSGSTGAGHHCLQYPSLDFEPDALYALGSPIAIFECIRGVESLGLDFCLPTCRSFFNIFHPYDPIAYRIEPLINPQLKELKPDLIPHHKGRKRMHLELKDTMARVGADLKQKLVESLRSTWNKWKSQPTDGNLERVVEEDIDRELLGDPTKEELAKAKELSTPEMLGRLNGGRRIDYVLQEAPLEMINEYLFAMSSHVGYWESEDTMLLMLREIYSALGIQPDSTVPQQSMTVQRTRTLNPSVFISDKPSTSGGMN